MGGSSKSATTQTVSTNQTDRRVGAADQAMVATEAGKIRTDTRTNIKIERADAPIISAALGYGGQALAEVLAFSERQEAKGRQLVESALTSQASVIDKLDPSAGTAELRPFLLASTAIAGLALVVLAWRR